MRDFLAGSGVMAERGENIRDLAAGADGFAKELQNG
jgi:hypothetical protein